MEIAQTRFWRGQDLAWLCVGCVNGYLAFELYHFQDHDQWFCLKYHESLMLQSDHSPEHLYHNQRVSAENWMVKSFDPVREW